MIIYPVFKFGILEISVMTDLAISIVISANVTQANISVSRTAKPTLFD